MSGRSMRGSNRKVAYTAPGAPSESVGAKKEEAVSKAIIAAKPYAVAAAKHVGTMLVTEIAERTARHIAAKHNPGPQEK